ncbi:MAG: ABC transporter ATP-binding protein [Verrucomicrobiota bacterium]|nr:ABC transporter ATP-binding protein [Verrucomicrobiota bacterium]
MIEIKNISKSYSNGENRVHALRGLSTQIAQGEFIAITGPSGCGKSTLLHLLGGLDVPDEGDITFHDESIVSGNDRSLTLFRRTHIGIVFQFFNLLPTLTVEENVLLPLMLKSIPHQEAVGRARELLTTVGMSSRHHHFPHQLSGGEMQRTAIARALIHRPAILLADEPTGNLDSKTGALILSLFQEIAGTGDTTLILVTHSPEVAACARRQIQMSDGQITSDHTP